MDIKDKGLMAVLEEIEKSMLIFKELIEDFFSNLENNTLQKVLEEYLMFFMYCAISMFQESGAGQSEIDEFQREFYQKMLKNKLLKATTLLDYMETSKNRYLDFFRILSGNGKEEQLTGKKLNILIAKEALYLEKLLPKTDKDICSKIYKDLFVTYNSLLLEIQLLFYSKDNH